jgi:hypothetical protein
VTWLPGLQDREGWRLLEQSENGTWTAWRREGEGYAVTSGYTPTEPDLDDQVTQAVLRSIWAGL